MRRSVSQVVRPILILILAVVTLGPPAQASAAEWVQNFRPVQLWSGPDRGAISFGTAPQWDYFKVHSTAENGRLYVLVARTNNFAFIDSADVGPSGAPPLGWPAANSEPAAAAPVPPGPDAIHAAIGPIPGYPIHADPRLWPALQVLQSIRHTWTLQALASSGTRLEWDTLEPDAAGMYQPSRGVVTFNLRWVKSDPRALAALIEHEAKHVADMMAGVDVTSPEGCLLTEINAFREEAKTWGELVGPNGKADPSDDLERSLNYKLSLFRSKPEGIESLISQSPGYRLQCRLS